jgi:hypothetical protein
MHSPRTLPRQHRFLAVAFTVLLLGALTAWRWHRTHPPEPVFGGKRLSEWLFPMAWDFDWIPNDVYGHIHDELWERLIHPSDSSPASAMATASGPGVAGPPHLDTNAIPWLIRWMGARPTRWDLVRHRLADHLPDRLAKLMDPFPATRWGERHIRWHVAACEGFTLLGTNATTALPALSNLLSSTTNADLPLTSAIANIGPQGIAVLTNALTSTNAQRRDQAALALGLHYAEAGMALPVLVGCVERGVASYHVLGAIGRIGGEDPRVVPALVRLLTMTNLPPGGALDQAMAILVLGLQGHRAQAAIPLLQARYESAIATGDIINRKLLRRVLICISPHKIQLPPPAPGEAGDDWP